MARRRRTHVAEHRDLLPSLMLVRMGTHRSDTKRRSLAVARHRLSSFHVMKGRGLGCCPLVAFAAPADLTSF